MSKNLQDITVPDLGGASEVDVIEVLVKVGDAVAIDDGLVTLESDKASMEVPSPYAGIIKSVVINLGDSLKEGDVIATIQLSDGIADATVTEDSSAVDGELAAAQDDASSAEGGGMVVPSTPTERGSIYAGPGVRRIAREFELDLSLIKGTGEKNRITKEDVQAYVKQRMRSGAVSTDAGDFSVAPMPELDFSSFGEVYQEPLSKINCLTGRFLHRNWVSIPHVTQFDEADITDMEAFRQKEKSNAAAQGVKLTPIVFIMKAVVAALQQFPRFNTSLSTDGKSLIQKRYYHVGVAVDTPNGLVVPVIRDVDKKSVLTLAKELGDISTKAREKGLSVNEMQGGCFTISSLGGIGGSAFTPIVNAPEVAILGVSRSLMKPIYQKDTGEFLARLMLPLSLSYDHRVIDGADGARFVTFLSSRLSDLRTLIL